MWSGNGRTLSSEGNIFSENFQFLAHDLAHKFRQTELSNNINSLYYTSEDSKSAGFNILVWLSRNLRDIITYLA